jgi:hypothetical protein
MGGAYSTSRKRRDAYRILVGNLEGNGQLGRLKLSWVNYIMIVLRETNICGLDWIDLAQDKNQWSALVNTGTNEFHKILGSS